MNSFGSKEFYIHATKKHEEDKFFFAVPLIVKLSHDFLRNYVILNRGTKAFKAITEVLNIDKFQYDEKEMNSEVWFLLEYDKKRKTLQGLNLILYAKKTGLFGSHIVEKKLSENHLKSIKNDQIVVFDINNKYFRNFKNVNLEVFKKIVQNQKMLHEIMNKYEIAMQRVIDELCIIHNKDKNLKGIKDLERITKSYKIENIVPRKKKLLKEVLNHGVDEKFSEDIMKT